MTIRGPRQQKGISRLCFGMMLILALMLRASIPDGFMPAGGKAGLAQMTICTGAAVAAQEQGSKKDRGPPHFTPCAFTLVLAHGAPPQTPVLPPPVFSQAAPFATLAFLADQTAIKPWFSRGPPHFLAQI